MSIIDKMKAALRAAEALGPPPTKEIRLHPDDMKQMRAQCVNLIQHQATVEGMWFGGVRLIEDEAAPRLPRKYAHRHTIPRNEPKVTHDSRKL